MIIKSSTRTHAGSYRVNSEVDARTRGQADGPVSDTVALAIAAGWMSPVDGRALAQLATTGQAGAEALLREIRAELRIVTNARDRAELDALRRWIGSKINSDLPSEEEDTHAEAWHAAHYA